MRLRRSNNFERHGKRWSGLKRNGNRGTGFDRSGQLLSRALALSVRRPPKFSQTKLKVRARERPVQQLPELISRSEEHTSELQSPCNLVCRLLLEKKKHQLC